MPTLGEDFVKVSCGQCGAKYALPVSRVRGRELSIRCKTCDFVFQVRDGQTSSAHSVLSLGAKCWFAVVNRQRIGPMTAHQVKEMYARGDISAATRLWRRGMRDWVALGEISALGDLDEHDGTLGHDAAEDEPTRAREVNPLIWAEAVDADGEMEAAVTRVGVPDIDGLEREAASGLEAEDEGAGAQPRTLRTTDIPTVVDPSALARAAESAVDRDEELAAAIASEQTMEYPPGFAEAATGKHRVISTAADDAAGAGHQSAGSGERKVLSPIARLLADREASRPGAQLPGQLLRQRHENSVLFSLDQLIPEEVVPQAPEPASPWAALVGAHASGVADVDVGLTAPPASALVRRARAQQRGAARRQLGRLFLAGFLGVVAVAACFSVGVYLLAPGVASWFSGSTGSLVESAMDTRASARALAPLAVQPPSLKPQSTPLERAVPSHHAGVTGPHGAKTSSGLQRAVSTAPSSDRAVTAVTPRARPSSVSAQALSRTARTPPHRRPEKVRKSRVSSAAAAPKTQRSRPAAMGAALTTDPSGGERAVASGDAPGHVPPAALTPEQVSAAIAPAKAQLKVCRDTYAQPAAMTVQMVVDGSSGEVKAAKVLSNLFDADLTACVLDVVRKNARFPRSIGRAVTITRLLVLR